MCTFLDRTDHLRQSGGLRPGDVVIALLYECFVVDVWICQDKSDDGPFTLMNLVHNLQIHIHGFDTPQILCF